jgi:hypothetical protein
MREPIYEIHIRGQLDADWAEWFDDMTLTYCGDDNEETILCGALRDQAQLYGILNKLRTLNLALLSVSSRYQKGDIR